MEFKEKINQIIIQGEGRVVDVFYELFTVISSLEAEMQATAFQYMCENIKKVDLDEENNFVIKEHFTEEQLKKYLPKVKARFTNKIKTLIFDSSKENISTEDFYREAWALIKSNKICKNKHEKALATFLLVDNNFIPYRAVGKGISMDDETYSSIIDSLDTDIIRDAEMIMQIDFDQKTQKSSLLLEKLNAVSTFEEKTVFLSMIIEMAEERVKNEIKTSIDNI